MFGMFLPKKKKILKSFVEPHKDDYLSPLFLGKKLYFYIRKEEEQEARLRTVLKIELNTSYIENTVVWPSPPFCY